VAIQDSLESVDIVVTVVSLVTLASLEFLASAASQAIQEPLDTQVSRVTQVLVENQVIPVSQESLDTVE